MPGSVATGARAKMGHIVRLSHWNAQLVRSERLPLDDATRRGGGGPFRVPGCYLHHAGGHWSAGPWHSWSATGPITTVFWRRIGHGTNNGRRGGWEELAAAGARLKGLDHPIGMAVAQTEDANDDLYPVL